MACKTFSAVGKGDGVLFFCGIRIDVTQRSHQTPLPFGDRGEKVQRKGAPDSVGVFQQDLLIVYHILVGVENA